MYKQILFLPTSPIDEESFEQRTLLLMLFGVDDSRRLWKRPAGVDGAESGLTILSSVKEVPELGRCNLLGPDTGEIELRNMELAIFTAMSELSMPEILVNEP